VAIRIQGVVCGRAMKVVVFLLLVYREFPAGEQSSRMWLGVKPLHQSHGNSHLSHILHNLSNICRWPSNPTLFEKSFADDLTIILASLASLGKALRSLQA